MSKKQTLRLDQLEQFKEYVLVSIDPISAWVRNDLVGERCILSPTTTNFLHFPDRLDITPNKKDEIYILDTDQTTFHEL